MIFREATLLKKCPCHKEEAQIIKKKAKKKKIIGKKVFLIRQQLLGRTQGEGGNII